MKHEHHECYFCDWIHKVPLNTQIDVDIDVCIDWGWIYNYFKKYPDATLINFRHDVTCVLELNDQTLIKTSTPQK